MKKISKILLLISGIALFISIFVPIWRIDLDAPQYPEGLELLIYSNKLGGQVDIINGLNHYIGMRTLHADDFMEFTVLPYIIGFFGFMNLLAIWLNNKKFLNALFIAFVLFGVVAMIDFWRWEYDYGHNLDPNAAIVVPGMAYQPPLIGFKQLLNFGAYSIPALGGWLFIASGIILLVVVYLEKSFWFMRKSTLVKSIIILFGSSVFTACSVDGPQAIKYNYDQCESCKMTISDERFACELLTQKGRAYKFDDLSCLLDYKKNMEVDVKNIYVNDYIYKKELHDVSHMQFIKHEVFSSPMQGNIAAFMNMDSVNAYANKLKVVRLTWSQILE